MLGTQKAILLCTMFFCVMMESVLLAMYHEDKREKPQKDMQDVLEVLERLRLDEKEYETKAPKRTNILRFKGLLYFIEHEKDPKKLLHLFRCTKLAPKETIKKYKDALRKERAKPFEISQPCDMVYLNRLIENYTSIKKQTGKDARARINFLRFEALTFFQKYIKNKDVFRLIFHSIQRYPDRAIKLYFFCLEYYCLNALNQALIDYIEDFITTQLLRHSPSLDLQFLSFERNDDGLPELVHRGFGPWGGDIYDREPPSQSWCCVS